MIGTTQNDWISNIEASTDPNALLEKGISFNERSKTLSEKFISVEFLAPFPRYNFSMKPEIESMTTQLSNLGHVPSLFCPLNFSIVFATNSSGFNVNWMLFQIEQEIAEAQKDLMSQRNLDVPLAVEA